MTHRPRSAGRYRRSLAPVVGLLLTFAAVATGVGWAQEGDARADPGATVALYLTWQSDPTTTMTIEWHTEGRGRGARLEFQRQGEGDWDDREPETIPFPHAAEVAGVDRMIHRVELTGLEPGSTYEFRTDAGGENYTFRTMPAQLDRPVRFATGGDVQRNENMERVSDLAASYDPDFIMWGGDLAYANGLSQNVRHWFQFFDATYRTLITPERRVIPVLVAIGNHEVEGFFIDNHPDYEQNDATRARMAPFFYEVFAMPGQPGYRVLDFADYMTVLLLDTDHTNPVDGEQAEWLDDRLAERRDVPHVFPLYHIPAYPSVRSPDERSARVRSIWVPLFEAHGIEVAFENHDHAYKRTYPLRGGERSNDGIVYIGDGAWGVNPRPVGRDYEGGIAPYLEHAIPVRHFILGELRGDERYFIAVDDTGKVIDEFPEGSASVIGAPRFRVSGAVR